MPIVYVAGAYRGKSENDVWENIMHARTAARQLWKEGWVVICPHANSIFMGGGDIEEDVFLDGGLDILRRCDAIYMLSNWKNSVGSRKELNLAYELGLGILWEEE